MAHLAASAQSGGVKVHLALLYSLKTKIDDTFGILNLQPLILR